MAIQDDVDILGFEIARRVVMFKSGTVMPDNSLLDYNGDPNNATTSTNGEKLLRNSPIGTLYIEDDGTMWRKTVLSTNTWSELGTGSGGSGSGGGSSISDTLTAKWDDTATSYAATSAIHTQVFTRGSLSVNMASPSATFIAMQESNFAADGYWHEVNSKHVMVLPYDTYVKKIMFRSTGSSGEIVSIGVHSNRDITNTSSEEYKYFEPTPIETQTYTFANNNQSQGYVYTPAASASAGDTLGVSVSATGDVGLASLTIVLDFIKD
jgi:hypothetical protein